MRRNGFIAILAGLTACGGGGDTAFLVPAPAEIQLAAKAAATPELPCSADTDEGIDGTVDATWTFAYSDQGRHERDVERDLQGNIIEDWTFEYDNAGRFIAYAITSTSDGVSYSLAYRINYDAFGRRLGSQADNDGDGHFETVETMNAWNEAGLWTMSTTVAGVSTYTTTSTYDSHGRPLERRATNGDGTMRSLNTYVYDDVARTRTLTAVRPTFTLTQVYRWDAAGNLVGASFANQHDGVTDPLTTIEYTYEGDRNTTETEHDSVGSRRTTYHFCN